MLFNIITNLWESFVIFVFGMIIIFIISFILRLNFSWKIFKVLLSTVILSSLVNITKITIPEQNQYIALLVLSLFYLFIFYIIKKIKKWSTKLWKIKHSLIFVIFLIFVMFAWKWEFLDNWSRVISNDINIWTSGEVLYKSFWWIKSSVWLFNEYWDSNSDYDTIKYDLNLDGFVDIKTIDIDENSEIDDIVVYTYNVQKIILFILLLIFIILTYLFSDWWNKKIKKQKWNNKKKLDLKGLKILWNNNIEKDDNFKKWLSIVLLLFMLLQIWYVSAYREVDLIWTPEYIKWDKICTYLINLNWCKNCNKTFIPQWKKDFYIIGTEWYIKNIIKTCNSKTRVALSRFQLGENIKGSVIEYIKYMNKELYKSNNNINKFSTIDNEDFSRVNTRIINEENKKWDIIWKQLDTSKITDLVVDEWVSWNDESSIWYIDSINKGLNNKWEDTIISEVKKMKKVIAKDGVIEKWNKGNNIKKNVDNAFKAIKLINDSSSAAIDWINKMKPFLKKINDWSVIDPKTIKQIKWIFRKLSWEGNKFKVITNLIDISKKTWVYIKKIWWKFWKVFNWLGVLWDVIGWYDTYKSSQKKYEWNDSKIYTDASTKVIWKTLIWSNPVDFGMWLLSWAATMIWQDKIAKTIDDNTLWSRYEQLIDIANNDEGSSIDKTVDSSATDFLNVYNNPKSWTVDKIMEYGKFSSVMIVWLLWFATQSWMSIIEWWFSAFWWWVNEITKFFK